MDSGYPAHWPHSHGRWRHSCPGLYISPSPPWRGNLLPTHTAQRSILWRCSRYRPGILTRVVRGESAQAAAPDEAAHWRAVLAAMALSPAQSSAISETRAALLTRMDSVSGFWGGGEKALRQGTPRGPVNRVARQSSGLDGLMSVLAWDQTLWPPCPCTHGSSPPSHPSRIPTGPGQAPQAAGAPGGAAQPRLPARHSGPTGGEAVRVGRDGGGGAFGGSPGRPGARSARASAPYPGPPGLSLSPSLACPPFPPLCSGSGPRRPWQQTWTRKKWRTGTPTWRPLRTRFLCARSA